jgi:hypothetical protein
MSRWFRHYAGMMSDPKFGGVARFCKRSRAEVLFVWGCLLESASEYDSAVYGWDADAVAELLGIETETAQAIHDALEAKGLIGGGRIEAWDKRQFKSDDSSERVRKHRSSRKAVTEQSHNADETACNGDVTPPETEAEPEADTTTVAKAPVVGRAKAPKAARASRLCPESWTPSAADQDVGRREGLSEADLERELAKFRDHEFRTAHSSWSKTYRNWMRTAADRMRADRGARPNPAQPAVSVDIAKIDADRARIRAMFETEDTAA